MVELRKRKAPTEAASAPPAKKTSKVKGPKGAATHATSGAKTLPADGTNGKSRVDHPVDLTSFGGEIERNDGEKVTLKQLLEESKSGVIIFTYPKASTPGCTTQACLFRDAYSSLTATGFAIYGLSKDSPKSNTNFKTKQNLPFSLLCDPSASLIDAIGMKKAPSGTIRGVFVMDKEGKVLAAKAGGPAATVEVVRGLIAGNGFTGNKDTKDEADDIPKNSDVEKVIEEADTNIEEFKVSDETNGTVGKIGSAAEDTAQAEVAADVADTAVKLDA